MGVEDQEIVLLFSGKLARHKGPHVLIDAVRLMPKADRSRISVVFLGSGPEQVRLEAQAGGNDPVRVHFAGFQNQTQLSPYYHSADLMVMPSAPYRSYRETWGLVVNETLHHGVPCVVSDSVGCAVDLIESGVTGEITATRNPESLAVGILHALRLSRDPEIRRKCRERVNQFSVERAAEGIAKAYRSVIRN
jgi:glycosyltransferase involved in cell wall biosynthesis